MARSAIVLPGRGPAGITGIMTGIAPFTVNPRKGAAGYAPRYHTRALVTRPHNPGD